MDRREEDTHPTAGLRTAAALTPKGNVGANGAGRGGGGKAPASKCSDLSFLPRRRTRPLLSSPTREDREPASVTRGAQAKALRAETNQAWCEGKPHKSQLCAQAATPRRKRSSRAGAPRGAAPQGDRVRFRGTEGHHQRPPPGTGCTRGRPRRQTPTARVSPFPTSQLEQLRAPVPLLLRSEFGRAERKLGLRAEPPAAGVRSHCAFPSGTPNGADSTIRRAQDSEELLLAGSTRFQVLKPPTARVPSTRPATYSHLGGGSREHRGGGTRFFPTTSYPRTRPQCPAPLPDVRPS